MSNFRETPLMPASSQVSGGSKEEEDWPELEITFNALASKHKGKMFLGCFPGASRSLVDSDKIIQLLSARINPQVVIRCFAPAAYILHNRSCIHRGLDIKGFRLAIQTLAYDCGKPLEEILATLTTPPALNLATNHRWIKGTNNHEAQDLKVAAPHKDVPEKMILVNFTMNSGLGADEFPPKPSVGGALGSRLAGFSSDMDSIAAVTDPVMEPPQLIKALFNKRLEWDLNLPSEAMITAAGDVSLTISKNISSPSVEALPIMAREADTPLPHGQSIATDRQLEFLSGPSFEATSADNSVSDTASDVNDLDFWTKLIDETPWPEFQHPSGCNSPFSGPLRREVPLTWRYSL